MPSLPSTLALSGWPVDGSAMVAAPGRADLAAIQTAVNALIAAESGGTANQVLLATSSTAVAWGGGYTSYTPTLAASGGGSPTVGNGTVSSKYVQLGSLVHYYGILNLGSTTSFGTGTLLIPVPVAASVGALNWGTADLLDVSTGNAGFGYAYSGTSTSNFQILLGATYLGARTAVSGTANFPWAWATGDTISWNLTYQAA